MGKRSAAAHNLLTTSFRSNWSSAGDSSKYWMVSMRDDILIAGYHSLVYFFAICIRIQSIGLHIPGGRGGRKQLDVILMWDDQMHDLICTSPDRHQARIP